MVKICSTASHAITFIYSQLAVEHFLHQKVDTVLIIILDTEISELWLNISNGAWKFPSLGNKMLCYIFRHPSNNFVLTQKNLRGQFDTCWFDTQLDESDDPSSNPDDCLIFSDTDPSPRSSRSSLTTRDQTSTWSKNRFVNRFCLNKAHLKLSAFDSAQCSRWFHLCRDQCDQLVWVKSRPIFQNDSKLLRNN